MVGNGFPAEPSAPSLSALALICKTASGRASASDVGNSEEKSATTRDASASTEAGLTAASGGVEAGEGNGGTESACEVAASVTDGIIGVASARDTSLGETESRHEANSAAKPLWNWDRCKGEGCMEDMRYSA